MPFYNKNFWTDCREVKKGVEVIMENDVDHRKELVGLINQLGQKHGVYQVFNDFLEMTSIAISNAVDKAQYEERESAYHEIISRYEKIEIDKFPDMFVHLTEELEKYAEHPTDVLGEVFHELELHNKYVGRFFTPQHISDFMGAVTLGENDLTIKEKGYLTLCEPCVGGGAMVLGFANAMKDNGYHFQKQMVVSATDIDLKCVHMSYIQLSLYGIPAVVTHGNTLTLEKWSNWYTPSYVFGNWSLRQSVHEQNHEEAVVKTPTPEEVEEFEALQENKMGQIMFGM